MKNIWHRNNDKNDSIELSMQKHFFIRSNGKYIRINISDILYIEGCRNYVKIVTTNKSLLVLITLKRIEQFLPVGLFVRIHKSYIISLDYLLWFDSDQVQVLSRQLPVGAQYKGVLEKHVLIMQEKTDSFSALEHIAGETYIRRVAS